MLSSGRRFRVKRIERQNEINKLASRCHLHRRGARIAHVGWYFQLATLNLVFCDRSNVRKSRQYPCDSAPLGPLWRTPSSSTQETSTNWTTLSEKVIRTARVLPSEPRQPTTSSRVTSPILRGVDRIAT